MNHLKMRKLVLIVILTNSFTACAIFSMKKSNDVSVKIRFHCDADIEILPSSISLYSMQNKNEYKLYKSVEFNRKEKEVSFNSVKIGTYLIGVGFKFVLYDGKEIEYVHYDQRGSKREESIGEIKNGVIGSKWTTDASRPNEIRVKKGDVLVDINCTIYFFNRENLDRNSEEWENIENLELQIKKGNFLFLNDKCFMKYTTLFDSKKTTKSKNIDLYELKMFMHAFKDCLEKRGQHE